MVEALSIFFALYRGVYKQKCNSCTFLRCSLHLISGPFHPYPFSAAPKPCCVVPRSQTQNPCCVMQYFLLNSEPIANLFLYKFLCRKLDQIHWRLSFYHRCFGGNSWPTLLASRLPLISHFFPHCHDDQTNKHI